MVFSQRDIPEDPLPGGLRMQNRRSQFDADLFMRSSIVAVRNNVTGGQGDGRFYSILFLARSNGEANPRRCFGNCGIGIINLCFLADCGLRRLFSPADLELEEFAFGAGDAGGVVFFPFWRKCVGLGGFGSDRKSVV